MSKLHSKPYEEIAIIGYHCRFPDANHADQLWDNLAANKVSIANIPESRWTLSELANVAEGSHELFGGFLSDIDKFDPLMFNISPAEAKEMDPQLRLLIESVWGTLENGGYGKYRKQENTRIGLFVGSMWNDYSLLKNNSAEHRLQNIGSQSWELANRISFATNLKGPSLVVNTACSASSMAVHLACKSLQAGECEMAVAGGVNLILHPGRYAYLTGEGLLSVKREKKLFESGSEGYVPGEGVGSLLLKPLKNAVVDGDFIHAVIIASGSNHNGGGPFYKAPNSESQACLLKKIYEEAEIDPRTIRWLEMASFGSESVDTTEWIGLVRAFENFTQDKQFCSIGSLKPNIGHLEAASGVSQLIKVILLLKKRILLPSRFSDMAEEELEVQESPFILQKSAQRVEPNGAYPIRAGINAFGAGGTNVHIVLEEYIPPVKPVGETKNSASEFLAILSAKDEKVLRQYAEDLVAYINSASHPPAMQDLVYTLQTGREEMNERLAILASGTEELCKKIKKYLKGKKDISVYVGSLNESAIANLHNGDAATNSQETAIKWTMGKQIDWTALYTGKEPRRVPLPSYPFRRDRYWLSGKNRSKNTEKITAVQGNPDVMEGDMRSYLKSMLSANINIPTEEIDEHISFARYGLTSMMIKRMNAELEKDLGDLPKTIFFEYENIHKMAVFLNNHYLRNLRSKLKHRREDAVHYSKTTAARKCSTVDIQRKEYCNEHPYDIAIIGLSGRYPRAESLEKYWENILAQRDCIVEIPISRWDYRQWYEKDYKSTKKSYSKWGGFLDDVDCFDPLFFEISPIEAEAMDPQERLFLQTAWEAVEDAGYRANQLNEEESMDSARTGVFVGAMWTDYQLYGAEEHLKGNYVNPGFSLHSIANRVSYCLDLKGPSLAIDTACSSSLVALHLACRSILSGECDTAIAGGVNLSLHPAKYVHLSRKKFYSPTGRCRSFSHFGDGFVSGEGVGAILLKTLDAAIREGDHIYALIKGTAVNHGGKTNGYTVPNPVVQAEVIGSALKRSGIHPRTINYIEAHGTGTSLGDPIEIEGLTRAFRNYTEEKQFCAIGSVKSNIGHLEAAAGIAGITKVLLQMRHKKIAPTLHSMELNRDINFKDSPFVVQQKCTDWKRLTLMEDGIARSYPRRAGISAFGSGGANAHVILEEYEACKQGKGKNKGPCLIVLSAKTDERLKAYASDMAVYLKNKCTGTNTKKKNDSFEFIQSCLIEKIATITMLKIKDINPEVNLKKYNLQIANYISLVEFIGFKFGIKLSLAMIKEKKTIYAISKYILKKSGRPEKVGKGHGTLSEHSSEIELEDVSYTLQNGRTPLEERLALIVRDTAEAAVMLERFAAGGNEKGKHYRGSIGQGKDHEILFGNTKKDELIHKMAAERNLEWLARLWISGEDIDWKLLYPCSAPNRISLPTYPFARERYWMPISQKQTNTGNNDNTLHPLLHCNASTLSEQMYISKFSGNEYYFQDHIVNNSAVMPGVVCLEMARAAGELAAGQHVMRIQNVTWLRPISAAQAAGGVHIALYKDHEKVNFKIYTYAKEQLKEHVSGSVKYKGHKEDDVNYETFDTLRERITTKLESEICYKLLKSAGLLYGRSFQSIRSMACGNRESLVRLECPDGNSGIDNPRQWCLIPSILDGALHAAAAYILHREKSTGGPYVPYQLDEIDIIRPLETQCWAHLTFSEKDSSSEDWFCHAVLLNEAGKVLAKLHKVRFAQINTGWRNFSKTADRTVAYFSPAWRESGVTVSEETWINKITGRLLLFDVNGELRERISRRYKKLRPVLISTGNQYNCIGDEHYEIDPDNPDDYRRMIKDLCQEGRTPGAVVHLWSKITQDCLDHDPDLQLKIGFRSLFNLSKALLESKLSHPVRILFLFETVKGRGNPYFSAISGYARAIRKENPFLLCKTIEFIRSSNSEISSLNAESVLEIIGTELGTEPREQEIRYDLGRRLTCDLRPEELSNHTYGEIPLKQEGVYLITGGLGGLGLIFARYITSRVRCRLALNGRSAPTQAIEKKLDKLRANGAEVLYFQADVSRQEEVEALLEEIQTQWGAIDGILHSAGVSLDSFLINKTPQEVVSVLGPKVHGTMHLHRCLGRKELDFFVLFSSTAGALGNAGQSDYAFGNCFMDHFAEMREKQRRQGLCRGQTLSIGWPYWREGGMRINAVVEQEFKTSLGMTPLETTDGLEAFRNCIGSDLPRITVIGGEIRKIEAAVMGLEVDCSHQPAVCVHESEKETSTGDRQLRLRRKIMNFLYTILSEVVKLPPNRMAPNDPFEKYGIDSVMIMSLNDRLEKHFGKLSKTLFYEYNSLAELVEYFLQDHSSSIDALTDEPSSATDTAVSLEYIEKQSKPYFEATKASNSGRMAKCVSSESRTQVAIIGLSGRYPRARTIGQLWKNLEAGQDCISEIPQERWDAELYFDPDKEHKGRSYSKWGGFLEDLDRFDPLFFNISPKEAIMLDPQQRILLETVWEAVEDAGYVRKDLAGRKIGVFMGIMWGQFQLFCTKDETGLMIPNESSYASIANRISYFFNLYGPSLAVDSMCSSSLLALHLACESIRNGECCLAIAGGVNLSLHPNKYLILSMGKFASTDGRCRSFGADGDGYVPGEGAGVVLLKPLDDALAERDNIYGVIRGTAINHGGRTSGYTVPNPVAQEKLIIEALERAAIKPETISYIEAHGTGTSMGDPIEITGLKRAFERFTQKKQFCPIGSVKSNLGHLEAASGIAALTKVLLQMRHKKLVPSLHSCNPNPNIDFQDSPFYVQQTIQPWKTSDGTPLRAGISSFGAGGSNAHIIVEAYNPPSVEKDSNENCVSILVLSAKNEERLIAYGKKLKTHLMTLKVGQSGCPSLRDILYTLQVGREAFEERAAAIVTSMDDILSVLRHLIEGVPSNQKVYRSNIKTDKIKDRSRYNAEMDQSIISKFVIEKNNEKVAELWASGVSIDWTILYKKEKPRRISLPTYAFARELFPIPQLGNHLALECQSGHTNIKVNNTAMHPLIDANESTLREEKFRKTFSGNEFYFSNHVIERKKILPGAALVEMARAAGEIALERRVTKIMDVVWRKPLEAHQLNSSVYVSFRSEKGHVFYKITSGAKNDVIHSNGRISFIPNRNVVKRRPKDGLVLKAKPTNRLEGAELYRRYQQLGYDYGHDFQVIRVIEWNENEALAELQLQAGCHHEEGFLFHPALLDGIFHSALVLVSCLEEPCHKYLPVSLGEIEVPVLDQLPAKIYARLQLITDRTHVERMTLNIEILDTQGVILSVIRDFCVALSAADMSSSEYKRKGVEAEVVYYTQQWVKSPILARKKRPEIDLGNLLVFNAGTSLGSAIAKRLTAEGRSGNIFVVNFGQRFRQIDKCTFELNPASAMDFSRLIQALGEKNRPSKVLYAWAQKISNFSSRSFYPLFYLVRTLMDRPLKAQVKILYIFGGDQDKAYPHNHAVISFARSLFAENPKFLCKSIEFKSEFERKTGNNEWVESIMHEFDEEGSLPSAVKYCRELRYKKEILETTEKVEKEKRNSFSMVKENGVYLITGGTGGLGFTLVKHFTAKNRCTIVLCGRSKLDTRKQKKLKTLSISGSKIVYLRSDVSKRRNVAVLIETIKTRFKKLDGIIHCAGITKDAWIIKKSEEDIRAVLGPKVDGTIFLDECSQGEKLDFFILFSSMSAVIGIEGQCDYAYANSFMDAYAEYRETLRKKKLRSGKSLSINWPFWKGGGMEMTEARKDFIHREFGLVSITPLEGRLALEAGLASVGNNLIVAKGERDKMNNAFRPTEKNFIGFEDEMELGLSEVQESKLSKKSVEFIRHVLSKEIRLQMEQINPDDEFEVYGIDSIMIMNMIRELEKYFGKLPKTLFFEYVTVRELAAYLLNNHRVAFSNYLQSHCEPVAQELTNIDLNAKNRFLEENELIQIEDRYRDDQIRDIAVIGMSGRYPLADDLDELWKNLKAGRDCIREIPKERRNFQGYETDKGQKDACYCRWGGFIENVDCFDAAFFRITPRDAKQMDPQQRLFLQVAYAAVEDAGYAGELRNRKKNDRQVGVFVGVMYGDYQLIGAEELVRKNIVTPNSAFWAIANRVSYFFNLHGPSLAIDTACSSSLTAIHIACESIRRKECTMAIAGGVNLSIHPSKYIALSKAKFLSSDGRCRSFGEGGDGYVPGEGVGAVLLKPLKAAIKEGDHIYGVIRGSSINHGGKTNGFTVPNPAAQEELISEALARADLYSERVSYVEAHGTGTLLGDPIEIAGLSNAYAKHTERKQFCSIGSIKSNIGHLEAAAGIAALTKVLLQLKYKKLVPSLHSEKVNPHINFKETPFRLQDRYADWEKDDKENDNSKEEWTRVAAISSFGAGGANAHLLVEEYLEQRSEHTSIEKKERSHLAIISAWTEDALHAQAVRLRTFLELKHDEAPLLRNIAFTLQAGREQLPVRLALVVKDLPALIRSLNAYIQLRPEDELPAGMYISGPSNMAKKYTETEEELLNIQELFSKQEYSRLASLWVNGINMDWSYLYEKTRGSYQRVSLPTYPFKGERYWIEVSRDDSKKSIRQPFAQGKPYPFLVNMIFRQGSTKTKHIFNIKDKVVRDYFVDGRPTVPGSCQIEIARKAGSIVGGSPIEVIKGVVWKRPLQLEGRALEVETEIITTVDGLNYRMVNKDHLYSKGKLILGGNGKSNQVEQIDIDAIRSRAIEQIGRENIYNIFKKKGLYYGSSYKLLDTIWCNRTEALGKVICAESKKDDLRNCLIHPMLMDCSLQSVIGIDLNKSKADDKFLSVPFSVGEIRILRENGSHRCCYAYSKKTKRQTHKNKHYYDISFLDHDGMPLFEISDLCIMDFPKK